MKLETYIKLFSGKIISESKLNNDTKIQLLNYIKENNIYDIIGLLLDGELKSTENKNEIINRFKSSDLPSKIDYFIKEDLPYLSQVSNYSDARDADRIHNDYKNCEENCNNFEGKQKQICKSTCKIKGYNSIIDELRSGLTDCRYRSDPDSCSDKINKLVDKLEEKIDKQNKKIEQYKQEIENKESE